MASLAQLIAQAHNIVVLTGAGISTESGIPDFRSPGGIWEQFRIIEYAEFMASPQARLEDWRRRFVMRDQLGEVSPNIGHKVIASWVNTGKCSTLITQNVDGLHHEAGTSAEAIIEIHGTARHATCTKCGLHYEIDQCRQMLEDTNAAPACTSCQGIIKSAVVMFGESMPQQKTRQAIEAAANCDLFIAIGTSLVVYPVAELPVIAKKSGARVAIINREKTGLDEIADVVVNRGIGETLADFLVV